MCQGFEKPALSHATTYVNCNWCRWWWTLLQKCFGLSKQHAENYRLFRRQGARSQAILISGVLSQFLSEFHCICSISTCDFPGTRAGRPARIPTIYGREYISKDLDTIAAKDREGHDHVNIESVIFSSFEHSIGGADAVAVPRPNLTEAQKNDAIKRAFSFAGLSMTLNSFSDAQRACLHGSGLSNIPATPPL